jgi:hypothetical protein
VQTGIGEARPARRPRGRSRFPVHLLWAGLLVFLLGIPAFAGAAAGTRFTAPASPSPIPVGGAGAAPARVIWGSPGSPGSSSLQPPTPALGPVTRLLHATPTGTVPWVGSSSSPGLHPSELALDAVRSCPTLPSGPAFALFRQYDIENAGVNFSFASTPASGEAVAPFPLNWTTSVHAGGLPPYHESVVVYPTNGSRIPVVNSTLANGSAALTVPGLFLLQATVIDATCTQWSWGYEYLLVEAPGVGAHPISVTVTPTGATVPARLDYAIVPGVALPANWSYLWVDPSGQTAGSAPSASATEYFPGVYNDTACVVTDRGAPYYCATSPNVTLGGASPVLLTDSVDPGPYPASVTVDARETAPSALPSGTRLALLTYDASDLAARANESSPFGVEVTTASSSAQIVRHLGCGTPWTPEWVLSPTGQCWQVGVAELLGADPAVDHGYLGSTLLEFNLTAAGNATDWFPSFSASYGPDEGVAPLNVTLTLTGSGGSAPYNYSVLVFGEDSAGPSGTYFPEIAANGSGWSGAARAIPLPLASAGLYLVTILAGDSAQGYAIGVLPVLEVSAPSVPPPLEVEANETGVVEGATGTNATFAANATGGVGPYTVQWAFGDGNFSSSRLGAAVDHTYTGPGNYSPTVTVTDGSGRSATVALPLVVVHSAARAGPAPLPAKGPPSGFSLAWGPTILAAEVAVALAVLAYAIRRRALRADGEALATGLGPKEGNGP